MPSPRRHWHTGPCGQVDFLSDLHLQASQPKTAQVFFRLLSQPSTSPLVILGDLFEVWVGDDWLDHPQAAFERDCLAALSSASRQRPLAWVCGNRDFLVGQRVHQQVGWVVLDDPAVIESPFGSCLVSHGDAGCLGDTDYQAFRGRVRHPDWQAGFLATPLEARLQQARKMRAQSQATQAQRDHWFDLDANWARRQLRSHDCQHLVHGHTHRPADQALQEDLYRHVLSDWDFDAASPPRGEVLRWDPLGYHRHMPAS